MRPAIAYVRDMQQWRKRAQKRLHLERTISVEAIRDRTMRFGICCDRAIIGGLVFLVLFTPFAFGSVHPWAYSLMEVLAFLLFGAAMAKLFVEKKSHTLSQEQGAGSREFADADLRNSSRGVFRSLLPLILFLVFVSFQLVPLPPAWLRVLSPATFEYYGHAFPGWPEGGDQRSEVKQQRSEVGGQRSEFVPVSDFRSLISDSSGRWLPLSLAPELTRADLLKFTAYAALLVLVLLYPVTSNGGEERFIRLLILAVFVSGLLVAATGFVQRFSWNGKILWFFVPYDWAEYARNGVQRASGPFVNADHFAGYLALIFPLPVAGLFFARAFGPVRFRLAWLIACAACAALLFTGILLSLSRSGWMAMLLSLVLLVELKARMDRRAAGPSVPSTISRPRLAALGLRFPAGGLRSIAVIVCALLIVSLFLIGNSGREQLDHRLGETVSTNSSLRGRIDVWNDSLEMIRDFPLFGVGLGAWPELFVRYRSLPWSATFYREAHNDYLELLAETGLVGFALLGWFFFRQGRILVRAVKAALPPQDAIVIAPILAALGAMALCEIFDFNLQIPANAFLFTLLLGLGLRRAHSGAPGATSAEPAHGRYQRSVLHVIRAAVAGRRSAVVFTALTCVGAAALAICALAQEQTPYPYSYNSANTRSIAAAKDLVLSRPTSAAAHLKLLRLTGDRVSPARQLATARAALWTDPNNPNLRDFYAAMLLRAGNDNEARTEITRSVAASPSMDTHLYLKKELFGRLSPAEQTAIEAGFRQAVGSSDREAAHSLAAYYAMSGHFLGQAKLYEATALRETTPAEQLESLLNAGLAYLKLPDLENAERVFRKAITVAPSDARAYQKLATEVYGARDFTRAEEIITEGAKAGAPTLALYLSLAAAANKADKPTETKRMLALAQKEIQDRIDQGSDPYPLYLELADGARQAGDHDYEIAALRKGLEARPRSRETLARLAAVYAEQNNFDRAALYLTRITNLESPTADAFFQLALAEEARYRFAAADRAYARAVALAPADASYRTRYEAFRSKLERDAAEAAKVSKTTEKAK